MIRAGLAVVSALAAVGGMLMPTASAAPSTTSTGSSSPTEVRTVAAVDSHGQPINGYRIGADAGEVDDCSEPSPSATADNIYFCYPYAAAAYACWPSPPNALLCLVDPADKELRRVTYTGALEPVHPNPTPQPLALTLDDGTTCLARSGGAWGIRSDGYSGVYSCKGNVNVLRKTTSNPPPAIDRSQPQWTVQLGKSDIGGDNNPPPQTHVVRIAWFVGNQG